MEENTSLRQRRIIPTKSSQPPVTRTNDEIEDQGPVISGLDVLRIVAILITASCALSYYLTASSSFIWGWSPAILKPGFVSSYLRGPLQLTPAQLAQYNGTDSSLPIYLSINNTIFDVSAGRPTYGPGGSYNVFAGRDATRAFVTGCFREDRTSDLRGAEEVYMFQDDPNDPDDQLLSSREKKTRAERERREARKKVQKEVEKWVSFYKNNKKYFEVGTVVEVEQPMGHPPRLCESAQKGRPKRKKTAKAAQKSDSGKPVQ